MASVKLEDRPGVLERKMVYYPKNSTFDDFMKNVSTKLDLQGADGVETVEELADSMIQRQVFVCIEFQHDANLTEFPKNLSYAIRFPSELRKGGTAFLSNWVTNLRFNPWLSTGGPRTKIGNFEDLYGGLPFYFSEGFIFLYDFFFIVISLKKKTANNKIYFSTGFLAVQSAIAASFFEIHAKDNFPHIVMKSFPYPPYTYDVLLSVLKFTFSLFLMLSSIYPCMNTVRFIVYEKQKQLKAAMEIMGLSNSLQWFAWFVRTMIIMLISITLIIISLKVIISSGLDLKFLKNLCRTV